MSRYIIGQNIYECFLNTLYSLMLLNSSGHAKPLRTLSVNHSGLQIGLFNELMLKIQPHLSSIMFKIQAHFYHFFVRNSDPF
jgi:hypothetical protein